MNDDSTQKGTIKRIRLTDARSLDEKKPNASKKMAFDKLCQTGSYNQIFNLFVGDEEKLKTEGDVWSQRV